MGLSVMATAYVIRIFEWIDGIDTTHIVLEYMLWNRGCTRVYFITKNSSFLMQSVKNLS